MVEYFNYSNVFLAENTTEIPKYTRINDYIIKLKEDKQLLFGPIYSLRSIELEILKTYIQTNLANSFIEFSKFFARVLIIFIKSQIKVFAFM